MTSAVGAFVADIPDVTPEQLAKLYAWTQSKFKRSQIGMNADGSSYTLSALCPDPAKTKRHWQSLLGTNMKHWGVEIPKGQKWLRAVSAEEYESIIQTPYAAPTPSSPASEPNEECEKASSPKLPAFPISGSAHHGCGGASALQLPRNLLTQRRMVQSC